jgi:purine-nucleoside phosphorylase
MGTGDRGRHSAATASGSAEAAWRNLAAELLERGARGARTLVVAGSGLGAVAEALAEPRRVSFEELEHMPASGVAGHAGAFVFGKLAGVPIVVQQGRVHLYEGRSAGEVTRSVRALASLGVRVLVLTNAAGGLRREWAPGTWMRITDHLNLQGATPLRAGEGGHGTPYSSELGLILDTAAREAGIALERGVYAGLPGPSYETPAEVALLARLGADAVGMSTVQEVLAGAAAGMDVVALSMISNPAAGLAGGPLAHADVVAAGVAAAPRLVSLLEAALPRWSSGS